MLKLWQMLRVTVYSVTLALFTAGCSGSSSLSFRESYRDFEKDLKDVSSMGDRKRGWYIESKNGKLMIYYFIKFPK